MYRLIFVFFIAFVVCVLRAKDAVLSQLDEVTPAASKLEHSPKPLPPVQ